MRLLLDTHTLLWWLNESASLPASARRLISDKGNEVLVSAASAWEIATKVRLGRLPSAVELAQDFIGHMEREGFEELPISVDHAIRAGLLPGFHKDPFDRMLVAQSQAENVSIVSNDEKFDAYNVRRLW
ncbi:MAG TPA: type II toxin-antitoxin system VapC family toxin [Terriglobales bacterium]|nr:type II toxin-antitoxin system VapC family toxin [Terriglobales bacterium]